MIRKLLSTTQPRSTCLRRLRTILPALAALSIVTSASADKLNVCPAGSGPMLYYVIDGVFGESEVPPHTTLFEYWQGTATFTDETRVERLVHERGAKLIEAVCLADIAAFQTRFGIHGYIYLGGELLSVWQFNASTWTWKRLGTVWFDYQAPFATGGSVGLQQYYGCYDEFQPAVVLNTGAWHTGLDRAAMAAPSEDVRETEFFSRVRGLLARAALAHMLARPCEPLTQQQWIEHFGVDVDYAVHYDVYDPNYAVSDPHP